LSGFGQKLLLHYFIFNNTNELLILKRYSAKPGKKSRYFFKSRLRIPVKHGIMNENDLREFVLNFFMDMFITTRIRVA